MPAVVETPTYLQQILSNRTYAADFSLHLIGFLGGATLFGLSFWLCRGITFVGKQRQTCFGFRWALLLFVISRLSVLVEYSLSENENLLGFFDSRDLKSPEQLSVLFLVRLFTVASDIVLVYSIIRGSLAPLQISATFHQARLVAICTTSLYAVLSIIQFASYVDYRARTIYASQFAPYPTIVLAVYPFYVAVALVLLGYGIFADKRSQSLQTSHRRLPRRMLLVIGIFVARLLAALIAHAIAYLSILSYVWAQNIVIDVFYNVGQLAIYTVMVLAYRRSKSLYTGPTNFPVSQPPQDHQGQMQMSYSGPNDFSTSEPPVSHSLQYYYPSQPLHYADNTHDPQQLTYTMLSQQQLQKPQMQAYSHGYTHSEALQPQPQPKTHVPSQHGTPAAIEAPIVSSPPAANTNTGATDTGKITSPE